jgi:hypothetical protein
MCERCKQRATREFLWDDGVAVRLYVSVCDSCHAKLQEEMRKDTLICEGCGIRPATRTASNNVPGAPPGARLSWTTCEECNAEDKRECKEERRAVKVVHMEDLKDHCTTRMITVWVDQGTGEARVTFSDEFHQSSSTFKLDVIQDVMSALQPLYEQYHHEIYNH